MADTTTEQAGRLAAAPAQAPAGSGVDAADGAVADDMLIEEISIDGMCGVY